MSKGLMTTKEAREMAKQIRIALLKGMMPGSGKVAMFCHAVLALDREVKRLYQQEQRVRDKLVSIEDLPFENEGEKKLGQEISSEILKIIPNSEDIDPKPKANGVPAAPEKEVEHEA